MRNYSRDELKTLIVRSLADFVVPCVTTDNDATNAVGLSARAAILCAATCFLYDQMANPLVEWHSARLNDTIRRLFRELDSFNLVLVKISCDQLRFLACLADAIFHHDIQYAINIINELNQCLVRLINAKPVHMSEQYERAILANMFALLDWCMSMPLKQLKEQDRATLVRNNFKLILHISATFRSAANNNSNNNEWSPEAEHIHLSSRFIIAHLLTQLDHFPFGPAGATKLVSSVNETSDLGVPELFGDDDELSAALYEQPNVQFFALNQQLLISFVELPMRAHHARHMAVATNHSTINNSSSKVNTSPTICRIIVRDFCGKNCWDACMLHSPAHSLPATYSLDLSNEAAAAASAANENADTAESNAPPPPPPPLFDFTQLAHVTCEQIPRHVDILDALLAYVSHSSPECRVEEIARPLNGIWAMSSPLAAVLGVEALKHRMSVQEALERAHLEQQQYHSKHKHTPSIQSLE